MDRSGWLSELLDSLVVFERSVLGFRINPTNRKLHKIKRQQLRLFIPSQLGKGVHNTVGRYCQHPNRMRWLPDYPKA